MDLLIATAKKYVGKTELSGNSGFLDADFEAKMKLVGWKKGEAWCAYFTELVFKERFPEKVNNFNRLFSASAVQTFKNFTANGYTAKSIPEAGDLVIWQMYKDGKPQWQGHAGIVIEATNAVTFKSIEGNTNDKGGREGYTIAVKTRETTKKSNGLNVMGFIKIF